MSQAAQGDGRTVHGTAADGAQIVRQEPAGKWFIEYGRQQMIPAQHITIGTAIRLALEDGASYYLGLPGGTRFDAGIREALKGTSH
ncbi:MAG: hypothetical protein ACOH1Y_14305 [Propionicimonas sp.]